MSALIGCTVPTSGVLDAQAGTKIGIRDYFWDQHNPGYLAGYANGRRGILSWKFRTNTGVIPATDISSGKYNTDFNTFLSVVLNLGMYEPVIAVQHEVDAKTAAQSGTPAQLDQALLKCSGLMRNHPLWKNSGAKVGVVLTGYRIADADRAPAFAGPLADCDVIVTDPYATATTTLEQEIADDLAYVAKTYPGKELQFGEWGVPSTKSTRVQEITNFAASLKTAPYAGVTAAYYWEGTGYGVMGTPAQAALVNAIKGSLPANPPTTDWQAKFAALQTSYDKLYAAAISAEGLLAAGVQ
jgi:hypothetical protein